MVKECVAANRLLGICHTEAMLKPASTNQTIEEALSSNQATLSTLSDIFRLARSLSKKLYLMAES